MDLILRDESPADLPVIDLIHQRAFAGHPHGRRNEHEIVRALRDDGCLAISLVAEWHGGGVGHLAISPVSISDGTPDWFGLGPVAVDLERRNQGIGGQLIEEALRRLRAFGGAGCVVLGEPDFYRRFGFTSEPGLVLPGVPPEFFLADHFAGRMPRGVVAYHSSFA